MVDMMAVTSVSVVAEVAPLDIVAAVVVVPDVEDVDVVIVAEDEPLENVAVVVDVVKGGGDIEPFEWRGWC